MTNQSSGSLNMSQEYFDEVCFENRDVFDLSEAEAVQETIQQLESDGKKLPSHLVLTFPTSDEGIRERKVNQHLKLSIARIQSETSLVENNCDTPGQRTDTDEGRGETLAATLQSLLVSLQEDETRRIPRFVVYGGFEGCIQLWRSRLMEGCDEYVYDLLLWTFQVERDVRNSETVLLLEDLQKHFLRLWPALLSTLESDLSSINDVEEWNLKRINQVLRLAHFAVKHSEPNKKALMAATSSTTTRAAPCILLDALDALTFTNQDSPDHHRLVGGPLCRLVAAVCTFDDFRMSDGPAPTVSSAHANVQIFYQENGVLRVARYLQDKKEATAILSLRAMAIHDEIVQAMVAVGVLETSTNLLVSILVDDSSKSNDTEESSAALEELTAVAGLFRNVCANDEIKSKLCVGDKSIVRHLISGMETYPDAAKLQEHACAAFGAMALRSPRNAEFLVHQNEVATWIVRAMLKHPQRTTVQRQGALALRNLVSRSTDLRARVLQAGAAEALKEIAAKHVSCQDEVYAALRDLGLSASMLRVEQDSSGQVVLKQTEMFGERQSNFRPVFD